MSSADAQMLRMREAVMRDKLSIFCATCSRYWEAKDKGLDFCQPPSACAGPLSGLDFPHYRGPITQTDRFCFVCGGISVYGVRAKSGTLTRTFGLCEVHPPLWANSIRQEDNVVLLTSPHHGGGLDLLKQPFRKQTLLEAMQEYDREVEKKYG